MNRFDIFEIRLRRSCNPQKRTHDKPTGNTTSSHLAECHFCMFNDSSLQSVYRTYTSSNLLKLFKSLLFRSSKMSINAARAVLKQGKTTLFICDFQERFAKAMLEFDKVLQNSVKLVNALKLLEAPILVTEQNPKALGKTMPQLDISCAKGPFEKTQFSMCTPDVRHALTTICYGSRPESIILIGLETHVCVENTAIDLRRDGYEVHIVADCCTSRTQEDRLLALERMKSIGCHISTSETVIFKLLKDAKHKEFKNVQSLIKTPTLYTGLVPASKI